MLFTPNQLVLLFLAHCTPGIPLQHFHLCILHFAFKCPLRTPLPWHTREMRTNPVTEHYNDKEERLIHGHTPQPIELALITDYCKWGQLNKQCLVYMFAGYIFDKQQKHSAGTWIVCSSPSWTILLQSKAVGLTCFHSLFGLFVTLFFLGAACVPKVLLGLTFTHCDGNYCLHCCNSATVIWLS